MASGTNLTFNPYPNPNLYAPVVNLLLNGTGTNLTFNPYPNPNLYAYL